MTSLPSVAGELGSFLIAQAAAGRYGRSGAVLGGHRGLDFAPLRALAQLLVGASATEPC
jgi:hypothetical protein